MAKFKAGDKVVVVDAQPVYDTYKNGDTGVVVQIDHKCHGYVLRDDGVMMYVYWDEVELIECGQDSHGAEALRSSILSIRQEREQTLSKLKDLDTQEAEAISQLNALGFSLFEEGEVNNPPSKTVLYAEDIEEDMTDPENWKVGDMFVCLSWHTNGEAYCAGDVCEMVGLENGKWPELKSPRGYVTGIALTNHFKFHSRPVK